MRMLAAALALTALTVSMLSCAGSQVKPPDDEQAYKEALEYLEGPWYKRDAQRAIDEFQSLLDLYPYSKYAILAELRVADAYFKKEDFLTAIENYKEFRKKHPKNENVHYTVFRIGLAYQNLSLSYDRDQISTENAAVSFSELITAFPESKYVEESGRRLRECNETLADNIMYIGKIYYRRSNYQSAMIRFEELLHRFPDSKPAEEAICMLARSMARSNQSEAAAATYMTLLKRHPSGKYADEALDYVSRRETR